MRVSLRIRSSMAVMSLLSVVGESCIIVIRCNRSSIFISNVFYSILRVAVLLISVITRSSLVSIIVLISDSV